MSERTLRALALVVAGICLLLFGAAVVLVWIGRDASEALPALNQSDSSLVRALNPLLFVALGLLIAWKKPRNLYGWVWLIIGLSLSCQNFAMSFGIQGVLLAPGTLPLALEVFSLSGMAWFVGIALAPFIFLLFPSGSLPSRRWRPVAWIVLAAMGLGLATGWALPGDVGNVPIRNPYGAEGQVGEIVSLLANVVVFVLFGAIFLGVLSLVVRYRRSTGAERQQLKWFAFGAAVFGIFLVSDFFIELPGVWEAVKEATFFAILPITIGIAILRNQLFDIDIIIRKTVTYVLVVALLLVVYFGSVILLQLVFANITGLQGNTIITVLSTLAIAALFVPLRNRIQDVIDKRFYRKKYDAQKVLSEFAETVRDETDLEKLTAELVNVVNDTMQPTSVSVWLKEMNDGQWVGKKSKG